MAVLHPAQVSTGVRDVDADAEGLCFLLDRIFDPLVECRRAVGCCDRRNCTRIQAILRFVRRNFRKQEDKVAGTGLMDAAHRRDHRLLEAKLTGMLADNVCADSQAAQVKDAIRRWMIAHASRCDRPQAVWSQKGTAQTIIE